MMIDHLESQVLGQSCGQSQDVDTETEDSAIVEIWGCPQPALLLTPVRVSHADHDQRQAAGEQWEPVSWELLVFVKLNNLLSLHHCWHPRYQLCHNLTTIDEMHRCCSLSLLVITASQQINILLKHEGECFIINQLSIYKIINMTESRQTILTTDEQMFIQYKDFLSSSSSEPTWKNIERWLACLNNDDLTAIIVIVWRRLQDTPF